jgi:hypothetical protein
MNRYTLFTDVDKTFSCKVDVGGVPLSECTARIILETKDFNVVFKGDINESGECNIPIKKLKGIFGENTTGNLTLEVIADTTLFEAWKSDFEVVTKKKVAVTEVKDFGVKKEQTPSISVKVEVPKPVFEVSNKFKKHRAILESQMKKQNVKTLVDLNGLFEKYKNINDRKKSLTESEMKVMYKQLKQKLL